MGFKTYMKSNMLLGKSRLAQGSTYNFIIFKIKKNSLHFKCYKYKIEIYLRTERYINWEKHSLLYTQNLKINVIPFCLIRGKLGENLSSRFERTLFWASTTDLERFSFSSKKWRLRINGNITYKKIQKTRLWIAIVSIFHFLSLRWYHVENLDSLNSTVLHYEKQSSDDKKNLVYLSVRIE